MAEHRMLLTRYLLGQMSPEERAGLEGKYVDNDELFDELITAENDLIDDYVRGRLGLQERLFEACFLSSPERRDRVEFAKSLMAYNLVASKSNASVNERHSGWKAIGRYFGETPASARFVLATLLLISAAGSTWLAVINRRLHSRIQAALGAEVQAQSQIQDLRRQITKLQESFSAKGQILDTSPAAGSVILSMTLGPDIARSAEHQQALLSLFRSVAAVRLFLNVSPRAGSTYSAVLETAEGAEIWRRSGLATQFDLGGSVITIQLSPNVLKRDDYVLRLFQAAPGGNPEEVGTYTFRVIK